MLDFGYRRLKGRTAPIAQYETEVTSHSGQPELPQKVIPSTTGLAQNQDLGNHSDQVGHDA